MRLQQILRKERSGRLLQLSWDALRYISAEETSRVNEQEVWVIVNLLPPFFISPQSHIAASAVQLMQQLTERFTESALADMIGHRTPLPSLFNRLSEPCSKSILHMAPIGQGHGVSSRRAPRRVVRHVT